MNDPLEKPKLASRIIGHWIEQNGLAPTIESKKRFDFTVGVQHASGREIVFCNSYAVVWESWLIVVSKSETASIPLNEIKSYRMVERNNEQESQVNRVIIKNNQVQTVPL